MTTSFKGIKKAVGMYNTNKNSCATIYVNLETKEVWCNYYASVNNYTNYGKEVIRVIGRNNLYNETTSMKEVSKLINEL